MLKQLAQTFLKYGYLTIIHPSAHSLEFIKKQDLYYVLADYCDCYPHVASILDLDYLFSDLNQVGTVYINCYLPFKLTKLLNDFLPKLRTKKAEHEFSHIIDTKKRIGYGYNNSCILLNNIKSVASKSYLLRLLSQVTTTNRKQNIHNLKKLTLLVKDNLLLNDCYKIANNLPDFNNKQKTIKLIKANIKHLLNLNDYSNVIHFARFAQHVQSSSQSYYLAYNAGITNCNSNHLKYLINQLLSIIKR